VNRSTKVGLLAQNDVVRNHLRVCWRNPQNGVNCGVCEKCVRTRLALLAHGVPYTSSFHGELTPAIVSSIDIGNRVQFDLIEEILSIPNSQLPPALGSALRQRLESFEAPPKRDLKKWKRWFFRGSR
jgi:hypothetical protein